VATLGQYPQARRLRPPPHPPGPAVTTCSGRARARRNPVG